jgi:hypothetical protein
MPFTLTREQLYDLVWSEAMKNLGSQIGISDVAIAKHCRKSEIPVPERGYWNKLHAGKPVTKVALPPADLGSVTHITMSGELPAALRARIKGEPGISEREEEIEILAERFRKRLGAVKAPRNFMPVHPVIASVLKKDEQRRQERAVNRFAWPEPRFESSFERRRLRVLNGLFLAVAKIGGDGWLRGDYAREIGLRIGDRSVMFELDHNGKASRPGYTPTPPSDPKNFKLRLSLGAAHGRAAHMTAWEDKDGCPLEDQLADVIIGVAVEAERSHREWIVRQITWQKEEREREEKAARARKEAEEKRERERLAAIERAKTDALLADVAGWRHAANIRLYVEAVRGASPDAEGIKAWSSWALAEADRLDSIRSGRALRLGYDDPSPEAAKALVQEA